MGAKKHQKGTDNIASKLWSITTSDLPDYKKKKKKKIQKKNTCLSVVNSPFCIRLKWCCIVPCLLFSCFSVLFKLVITSLGEERPALGAPRSFVCILCTRTFLSFFFSSCFQWLAAACDCGTPWTFLLTLFILFHLAHVLQVGLDGH